MRRPASLVPFDEAVFQLNHDSVLAPTIALPALGGRLAQRQGTGLDMCKRFCQFLGLFGGFAGFPFSLCLEALDQFTE